MHIDVLIDMWALSAVDGPIIVYPVHTYITRHTYQHTLLVKEAYTTKINIRTYMT